MALCAPFAPAVVQVARAALLSVTSSLLGNSLDPGARASRERALSFRDGSLRNVRIPLQSL